MYTRIIPLAIVFITTLSLVQHAFAAPEVRTFTISGYYSPIQNQTKYYTGSYEKEVVLNGYGNASASGSTPYKGMVAAPKSFPFGTVFLIEGVGWAVVEDRGGAIVTAEEKASLKYDRMDYWFGKGEDALKKALNWGKRNKNVTILPTKIQDIPKFTVKNQLEKGAVSEDVKILQQFLKSLGFGTEEASGTYGEATVQAVFEFQKWRGVIAKDTDSGAGVVGPRTLQELKTLATELDMLRQYKSNENKKSPPKKNAVPTVQDLFNTSLKEGDTGYMVYLLQERLEKLGFFTHPSKTYTFGPVTKASLIAYQKNRGIVTADTEAHAGVFEEKTRSTMKSEYK